MSKFLGRDIIPSNEKERILKLHSFNILNKYEQTGVFKHIAAMAAVLFKMPMVVINFVDEKVVVTESSVGMAHTVTVPREISLCSLAILQDAASIFENAQKELCLMQNPIVHGAFGLQFYAAAPIKTSDGFNIGAVALIDKITRTFTPDDVLLLEGLAQIVVEELEAIKPGEE